MSHVSWQRGSAYDQVTVRQLLTMTSGVRWTEDYTDAQSDWARSNRTVPAQGMSRTATYMRTLEREAEPGDKWVYKTGETHLLGDLVRGATGKPLAEYLSEKIWQPYGMEADATWVLDVSGSELAGCCIQATLRDFARFGQFVLDEGRIDGVPVVASDWFAEATTSHVQFDGSGRGYGYQWWTWGNGTFSAIGINGQVIYVNPTLRLVIVISSAWPEAVSRDRSAAQTEFILSVQAAIEAEARGGPVGVEPQEASSDLARTPGDLSALAELDSGLQHVRLGGVGTGSGSVGAVKQPLRALGPIPLEPFVAGPAADVVASAELGVGEEAALGLKDESLTFVHGIGLQPWHGRLQEFEKGASRYGSRLSPISVQESVTTQ